MFSSRRGRREGMGVLLLAYQLYSFGVERVPPVTLAAIVGQSAIFLGFVPFLDPSHSTHRYCVLPARVWFGGRHELWRLVYSAVMHASDMHLYFNMVSLLWKGSRLERRFGSVYFAVLLGAFALLTNALIVALSVGLEEFLDVHHFHLMQQCAVGFSGVLFALKVLCNHYFPYEDSRLLGWLPVPSRWACWAELLLIQILVPNASFIGHLAGILVGLAFVHGPVRPAVNWLAACFSGGRNVGRNRPRFHGSGSTGGRRARDADADADVDGRYARYTANYSEEQQMRWAYEESQRMRGD